MLFVGPVYEGVADLYCTVTLHKKVGCFLVLYIGIGFVLTVYKITI